MAQSLTELGSWNGESVTAGQVLDALGGLRHGEQRTATRTAVVNLVVVAATEEEASRAGEAIRRMAGRHPGRTIVLLCDRSRSGPIDAGVSLHELAADGERVWWEDISLQVKGKAVDHLDSLVEPLTLGDLPVVVWFVGRPVGGSDPLLGAADAVIVDSRAAGGPSVFGTFSELTSRRVVVDLSWIRLRPWRLLLAGLFDGVAYRPFVHAVVSAAVTGKAGPRHLLAGWLASRLGLSRSHFHQEDSRHASMTLDSDVGGRRGRFAVERDEGARLVHASADVDGGPAHREVMSLPDDSLPWSLAEAITHLSRDRVYDEALAMAAAF